MLRNLKAIYLEQGDMDHAAAAIERILLLGTYVGETRDLGLIRYRQGKLREGKDLLEKYLAAAPGEEADRPTVETYLAQVRSLLNRLN